MSVSTSKAVGSTVAAYVPQDGKKWYQQAHLVKLNFCVASLVMFSSANGYDGSLMNGLQALDQWQEYNRTPTGAWLGFINAIYWLGAGIGYPIAAWVANKYGRKIGIYFGYIWLILGIALTFSANPNTFVVSRLFIGFASAWFGCAAPLLINEIAYPTQRGVVNALYNCGWYIGGTIAGFVTFGTRNYAGNWAWRIPYIVQLTLPLIALPGLLIAPESARYLVSVDRVEEAQKVLFDSHAGGDRQSALVEHELLEITTTIVNEKTAAGGSSYADMFRTPGNRKRLAISISLGIFAQWVGNGVVSYYLSLVLTTVGVTSVTNQTLLAGFLQVWNLFFAVGAACCVDKLGRRVLFLASAATILVSFILITILSALFARTEHAAIGIAVIPMLFIFFAGYDIALTPMLTAYPCEIWNFNLRAKGLAVTWISTITAIFFNVFVNPIALESITWKYYIVFIAVAVIYGLTAFFYYPETRGHTLEQIALIFDGPNAAVPDTHVTAEEVQRRFSTKSMVVQIEKPYGSA